MRQILGDKLGHAVERAGQLQNAPVGNVPVGDDALPATLEDERSHARPPVPGDVELPPLQKLVLALPVQA